MGAIKDTYYDLSSLHRVEVKLRNLTTIAAIGLAIFIIWILASLPDNIGMIIAGSFGVELAIIGLIMFGSDYRNFRKNYYDSSQHLFEIAYPDGTFILITMGGIFQNIEPYERVEHSKVRFKGIEYGEEQLEALFKGELVSAIIPNLKFTLDQQSVKRMPYLRFYNYQTAILMEYNDMCPDPYILFWRIRTPPNMELQNIVIVPIPESLFLPYWEYEEKIFLPLKNKFKRLHSPKEWQDIIAAGTNI